jgi:hypothetical protein
MAMDLWDAEAQHKAAKADREFSRLPSPIGRRRSPARSITLWMHEADAMHARVSAPQAT